MSDLTDAAVKPNEESVTEPKELGGQSSTSMDTIVDDFVAVDAKDVTPEESTTSESTKVDGISQASNIHASGENEEQDGPGDGGTAEVQVDKNVNGVMEDDSGEQERIRVEEEERQREEERNRMEETRRAEDKQREEERRVEEERLREEEMKRAEEERQREEGMKRAEEEKQREEEERQKRKRKRAEEKG